MNRDRERDIEKERDEQRHRERERNLGKNRATQRHRQRRRKREFLKKNVFPSVHHFASLSVPICFRRTRIRKFLAVRKKLYAERGGRKKKGRRRIARKLNIPSGLADGDRTFCLLVVAHWLYLIVELVCPFVCLCDCLSMVLSLCVNVCLWDCLSVRLSVCVIFFCMCDCLSMVLSLCVIVCLWDCLSV